ncbi:arsenate reductase, glutathione/glutaredoxin type [Picosynechococcus sp. NKBG042902]|uniref:arsenate reductase, glutathione/glutaredoxin type n=1 Tax=Picosynechococcus sp. NKBG042902 TaxID=490193 RepID=UPI0004AB1799|nr:arsenate reductase, glutathione/glutaredoxin type [Picosynechococcus sp. NKBG042902]
MKKIMFVCRRNSCRSQMAEGWAKHLGADKVIVHSSGLEASRVHPGAIAIMAEVGLDLTPQTSNALAEFNPEDYDAVISLCGCGVNLPAAWVTRPLFEDWQIQDPDGQPPEIFRNVRNEIQEQVNRLLKKLTS